MADHIVDELYLRIFPGRIAHLYSEICSFFRALNVLKLYSGGHFLRMAINSDYLTKLIEVGIDLDDVKLILGHILNVNRVSARIHYICCRLLCLWRVTSLIHADL